MQTKPTMMMPVMSALIFRSRKFFMRGGAEWWGRGMRSGNGRRPAQREEGRYFMYRKSAGLTTDETGAFREAAAGGGRTGRGTERGGAPGRPPGRSGGGAGSPWGGLRGHMPQTPQGSTRGIARRRAVRPARPCGAGNARRGRVSSGFRRRDRPPRKRSFPAVRRWPGCRARPGRGPSR